MKAGRCPLQLHASLFLYVPWSHKVGVSVGVFLLWSTFAEAEQEDYASDQQNTRSCPANEEGLSKLPFLRIHHCWVVKVADDCVAHPADGDERGQKGKQIQTTPQGKGDVLASYIVVAAFALLCPTSCDAQGDDNQDYGDACERSGCLQLWWEN